MDFELGRFQCNFFIPNLFFHWLQQRTLVRALQKDLHRASLITTLKDLITDFAAQIAATGCRHLLDFSWLRPLSWFGFLTGQ